MVRCAKSHKFSSRIAKKLTFLTILAKTRNFPTTNGQLHLKGTSTHNFDDFNGF